jgi:hypothetical protein
MLKNPWIDPNGIDGARATLGFIAEPVVIAKPIADVKHEIW